MRTGRVVGGAIARHPVLSAAGAAGAAGAAVAALERGGGAAGKGFHVSRTTGRVVRNRHMRVTNPRALKRSLRRVSGFARVARRVLHFTSPGRKGRLRYKFPKRKRAA